MRSVPSRRTTRAGFTLLEILVAVTIIVILMALLIPVVGGARESARRAEVRAEISRLEQALEDFKTQFGVYPPSGVVIYEQREGTTGSDYNWGYDQDDEDRRLRSRAVIRQLWPKFDFTVDHDINLNGTIEPGAALLDGSEALLFFLGGNGQMVPSSLNGPKLTGFSKNPAKPFEQGGTRVGPFYEFDPGRIVDWDGDLLYEYVDALPARKEVRPYIYLNSYNGHGYQPAGENGDWGNLFDNEVSIGADTLQFRGYWQTGSDAAPGVFWKSKAFQIVSPGADGKWGVGGLYTEQNAEAIGEFDRDNITNFTSGTLAVQ